MPAPTVSVVIPTYNRTATLARAIRSVLSQTIDDLEVIVVDDASTVAVEPIVDGFDDDRLELLIHDVNRGGSAARNTGIERARGEYIAFLDSDDEWHPEKLHRQLTTLEGRSDEWVGAYCSYTRRRTGLLGHLRQLIENSGTRTASAVEGGSELVQHVLGLSHDFASGSTLLAGADVVADLDGFDESFERHQDLEFLVRLLHHGKLAHVTEPLVIIHDTGGANPEAVARAKERLLDKYADDVARLERGGLDVSSVHRMDLALTYFQDGAFTDGYHELLAADSYQPWMLGRTLASAWSGLSKKFRTDR